MNLKDAKILITGGAGFIGSHIAESLAKIGAEVIIYDNFSTGHNENIESIRNMKNVHVVTGDVMDLKSLLEVSKNVDIISHQAANLEISASLDSPIEDMTLNVGGTINVLEAAVRNNVKKVIFASSAAVYGEAKYVPEDEDHPKNPQWPYGASKLSAEAYCKMYHEFYGLNVVSLRYGIVYGVREWFGRVLTVFIKRVFLENEPPVVFGDGKQTRDYINVKDVVALHNLVAQNDDVVFDFFNVGSQTEITIYELAKLIVELSGKDFEIIFEDVPEGGFSKLVGRWRIPRELKRMMLGIEKAKRILGWSPRISLKEGIAEEISWIEKSPHRWNVRPRV
ncbi:MAG: SDR family NAD(P)-dependent oxidoreductase [Candidatus Njordarchaeum guaymaensis]